MLDGLRQLPVSKHSGVSFIKTISKLPSINIVAAASLHVETRSISYFCLETGRSLGRKPVTSWFIVEFVGHSKKMLSNYLSTRPFLAIYSVPT